MLRTDFNELTARDIQLHEWEKETFEAQAALSIKLKELDIEATKLEARIVSWFRIPLYILSLPVKVLALFPLAIYAVRAKEVPAEMWHLLSR